VSLHVAPGTNQSGTFIETKPMEGGLVAVNATALKGDIGKTGHVAVYGHPLRHRQGRISSRSPRRPAEIWQVTPAGPKLNLYIVGHYRTAVAEFQINMDLSRQRADRRPQALTPPMAWRRDRLRAYGGRPLGPRRLRPGTRKAKPKNRRVELVER